MLIVDEDDPRLAAVQTSLGALGILTNVELQLTEAYQLRERIEHWPLEEVRDRWDEGGAQARHFSFFWVQTEARSPSTA